MDTALLEQLPPVALGAAYGLFWSWEAIAGLTRGKRAADWRRRVRNMALTVMTIAIGIAGGELVMTLARWSEAAGFGLLYRLDLSLPAALLLGILATDLVEYLRHRLQHQVPFLWRFHRVHHSDTRIDATTSFRAHPLDIVSRPLLHAVLLPLIGVSPLAMLVATPLVLPVLVFQHADIRLPESLDRLLRLVLVTPGMHLLHHSQHQPETDSNYATFLSVWDRLFASYRVGRPEEIGLTGHDGPRHQTIGGLLATPWRPSAG
jgi:sterol desaturase/sphingolipid hydroxylase (fatty acid hydroxylase superfamily)